MDKNEIVWSEELEKKMRVFLKKKNECKGKMIVFKNRNFV